MRAHSSQLGPLGAEPAPAKSPETKTSSDNLRTLLDTFRSDYNTSKIRVLNQALKLTPEEATKFWPIYQKYEKELNAVIDRRVALIKKFVTLSNEGGLGLLSRMRREPHTRVCVDDRCAMDATDKR